MHGDPALPRIPRSRYRDLDRLLPPLPDPPQPSGTHVTDRRALSARKNSSDEDALGRELWAPDRVHPLPGGVKAPARDLVPDGFVAESERKKLAPGDDPVLPSHERLNTFRCH